MIDPFSGGRFRGLKILGLIGGACIAAGLFLLGSLFGGK